MKMSTATKKAVDSTLNIFKVLDEKEYIRIRDMINSFSTEDQLIEFLINPISIYTEPLKEPTGSILNKIIDSEGIIIDEIMNLPYIHKVEVDGVLYPVKSRKKLTMIPTYIRRNMQISIKEGKTSTSSNTSDVTGMSAGSAKNGQFSDTETTTILQHNGMDILKEVLGPLSHDAKAKKVYKSSLVKTGTVAMKDLPESDSKGVHMLMDQILKEMGIDSDLVTHPEE